MISPRQSIQRKKVKSQLSRNQSRVGMYHTQRQTAKVRTPHVGQDEHSMWTSSTDLTAVTVPFMTPWLKPKPNHACLSHSPRTAAQVPFHAFLSKGLPKETMTSSPGRELVPDVRRCILSYATPSNLPDSTPTARSCLGMSSFEKTNLCLAEEVACKNPGNSTSGMLRFLCQASLSSFQVRDAKSLSHQLGQWPWTSRFVEKRTRIIKHPGLLLTWMNISLITVVPVCENESVPALI